MTNHADGQPERKFTEAEIRACKLGDWEAKHRMTLAFTPLMNTLARKRAPDGSPETINSLLEAGKTGLFKACRKYSPDVGIAKFQIFALNYIEQAMDAVHNSFFSRLKNLFSGR